MDWLNEGREITQGKELAGESLTKLACVVIDVSLVELNAMTGLMRRTFVAKVLDLGRGWTYVLS